MSSKSTRHPAWVDKLFPIIFGVAGLALLTFGSRELIDGFSSSGWPKSDGIITESKLVRTKSGSSNKGVKAVIEYSYSVNGNQFASDRIRYGMSSYHTIIKSARERAGEWLGKYPVNSHVAIAYKPSDPGRSTLNAGVHYTAMIAPVMGLLFLAVTILLMRKARKEVSTDHSAL